MLNEKKKIIHLQIQEETVSVMVLEEDEETVRCAARRLNDRAKEIKEKNPSLGGSTLLAYLALEEHIANMKQNEKKTGGFFKRTAKSISEKIYAWLIDE